MVDKQPGEAPRILIATNRAEIRQHIYPILDDGQYQLSEASEHANIIGLCRLERPRLIILDSALGIALCTQIKAQLGAEASILAIVDSLHPAIIDGALEAG